MATSSGSQVRRNVLRAAPDGDSAHHVDEVRAVLAAPTTVAPSRDSSFRIVCKRAVQGRRLTVVIEEISGKSHWVVVTTWEAEQYG